MEATVAAPGIQPEPEKMPNTELVGALVSSAVATENSSAAPPGLHESIKLFVGQLPLTMNEEEMTKVFAKYGEVAEIHILRDRMTNTPKGAGFVKFIRRADGDRAIEAMHNAVSLDNSTRKIQLKYAQGENERLGCIDSETNPENKLFVGMLPYSATEADIQVLFAKFGEVSEVFLMTNPADGSSKGAAFVKLATRTAAETAMKALNGIHCMEPGRPPLKVTVPNVKAKRNIHQTMPMNPRNPMMMGYNPMMMGMGNMAFAGHGHGSGHQEFKLFVGGLPTAIEEETVRAVFQQFGPVKEVYIMMDKIKNVSKGSCFVKFMSREAADNAINTLNQQYSFPDSPRALTVSHANAPRSQMAPHFPHGAYGGMGMHGNMHGGMHGNMHGNMHNGMHGNMHGNMHGGMHGMSGMHNGRVGVNVGQIQSSGGGRHNPMKLFVGALPFNYTDTQLLELFSPYGVVQDTYLCRKPDGESKGSGFVTYGSAEEANTAIMSLNESVTLTGSSRPLAVRFADGQHKASAPLPQSQGNDPQQTGYYQGYPIDEGTAKRQRH